MVGLGLGLTSNALSDRECVTSKREITLFEVLCHSAIQRCCLSPIREVISLGLHFRTPRTCEAETY